MKNLIFIFILAGLILHSCTKAQQTTDMNGWFKAGSRPASYKVSNSDERYNNTKTYYIGSTDTVSAGFGTIMKFDESQKFNGKRVKMSAYIKSNNLTKNAGMWFRVDSKNLGEMLAFDNMYTRPIKGTSDWKKYEIVLDVSDNSSNIAFGLLINNEGEAWITEPTFDEVDKNVPVTDMLLNKPVENKKLGGWFKAGSLPNSYEIGLMTDNYTDKPVYYIKSIAQVVDGFGTIMKSIMNITDYKGKRLRLTGYVKTEGLDEYAGMWLRIDGENPEKSLAFDNMNDRPIKGTTDWTKYMVVLDAPQESTSLSYGVILKNSGTVYISGLDIEIVGSDVPTTK